MPITDEYMKEMITKTREYTVVILKATQKRNEPGAEKIIWEHGRRNFSLREEGKLPIACPINDGTEVKGIGIFTTSVEETKRLLPELLSEPRYHQWWLWSTLFTHGIKDLVYPRRPLEGTWRIS